MIERYRIEGSLLDRIDMHVEVPAVSARELRGHLYALVLVRSFWLFLKFQKPRRVVV